MYILDANIFIQSNRAHYGFDFVPAFWDWLDASHASKILCSTGSVGRELAAGKDDLTTWAAARGGLFVPLDAGCATSLRDLAIWANEPASGFTPGAIAEFLSAADYELVAFAHSHGHTVVTMERSEPARRNKVKIPNACDAMSVPWKTPFEMLRDEGARFVLS